MAILELLDDGGDTAERFRLRRDRTVLGREGADIEIPHDPQISASHVAIHRRQAEGEWHWILEDLNSTNGTFLRVARCPLNGQNAVLIGAHRYKFRTAGSTAAANTDTGPVGTQGWQVPTKEELQRATASLVRIFPDGTEKLMPFGEGDVHVGTDAPRCQLVIDDDPMVDDVHAVIKTAGGKTTLEDLKSSNGIWVSVRERRLAASSTFQIGEQRIRFRLL